jgi:hypothetical protein
MQIMADIGTIYSTQNIEYVFFVKAWATGKDNTVHINNKNIYLQHT